jgi:putative ABC transport system permease protein
MFGDFWYRIRSLLFSRRADAELAEELQFHLDRERDKLETRGVDGTEAQRRSAVAFGGISRTTEACRDARGVGLFTEVGKDVRYGWRSLRRSPLFALTIVGSLALGIGATTTAATVVYSGLLRPLPFPDDGRLITIDRVWTPTGGVSGITLDQFSRWRDGLSSAATLSAFTGERVTLRGAGPAQDVRAAFVVGNWFQMLGARPLVGRLFDDASPADEVVASHAFAMQHGVGEPAEMLGRTFTIGARPVRVIGVLPASFKIVDEADLWVLARGVSALAIFGDKDARTYRMIARVAPQQSIDAARAIATTAMMSLEPELQRQSWLMRVQPLRDRLLGDSKSVLLVFLAASVLVLLTACANVAMLLVNRAVARGHELSVRAALGASRARLLAVATIETAMLGIVGTVGGWWLARTATVLLQSRTEIGLPFLATWTSHGALALGAIGAGVFMVTIASAAPLLTYRRSSITTPLRSTTTTGSRASRRLRGGLVVAQLAMTVVLLTGAGLLGRTLLAVSRADLGLRAPERVISMHVPVGESLTPGARLALVERLVEDMRRLPGVVSAGAGAALPPVQAGLVFNIRVTNSDGLNATRAFDLVPATDGYLEALGARLIEGRTLTQADTLSSEALCVLSESAATHLRLVVDTAVGQRINLALPTSKGVRVKPVVVGVIRDVRYSGLDAPAHGGIYVSWRQLPMASAYLVARTTGDPAALTPALTQLVRDADPSIPIRSPQTIDDAVARAAVPRAVRFSLAGVFGIGAALLAIVGLSGALIRSVVERQRELAVRAAIGATPGQLLRDVLQHGMMLSASGVVAGVAICAALAQGMSSLLHGVQARDPLTYGGASAAVLTIALVACYWPARRAAAADPIALFRAE